MCCDSLRETAALESPASFFPLVSVFARLRSEDPSRTPAEVYQRSLEAIVTSGTPLARDSAAIENLKLSLALKESGPLLETFYQIYRNATSASDGVEAAKGCLAVLDGEAFTSIQSLVQRLPASNVASASR